MSSLVRVRLPAQLRILAGVGPEVVVEVTGPVTQRSVLGELEQRYPVLLGTIRDPLLTAKRRPFIRFFAGEADLSNEAPDELLPDAVARGARGIRGRRCNGRRLGGHGHTALVTLTSFCGGRLAWANASHPRLLLPRPNS